jgi:flagellar biosynthesis protein FlhG
VANLAASLARQGREVLVVDENTDDGIAAYYGVLARYDLQQVVDREKSLSEVILSVAPGIRVLPVARVVRHGSPAERCRAADPARVSHRDWAAGRCPSGRYASLDHPLGFSPLGLAAHETVIVVSPSSAAITEAYALIKKVSLGYARKHFRILVNKARAASEAQRDI